MTFYHQLLFHVIQAESARIGKHFLHPVFLIIFVIDDDIFKYMPYFRNGLSVALELIRLFRSFYSAISIVWISATCEFLKSPCPIPTQIQITASLMPWLTQQVLPTSICQLCSFIVYSHFINKTEIGLSCSPILASCVSWWSQALC